MKKYFSLIIFLFQILPANASIKIEVIKKLKQTENINFNFIQKINEKTENKFLITNLSMLSLRLILYTCPSVIPGLQFLASSQISPSAHSMVAK